MKVVHINAHRGDGAALCALRISQALKSKGIETSMIVSNGTSDGVFTVAECDKNIWNRHRVLRRLKNLMLRLHLCHDYEQMQRDFRQAYRHTDTPVYAHLPLSAFRNLAHHPLVKEADIVHLHWVSGFVDYPTFFSEVRKPIVWTIHDKYPAVGLLHYNSTFFPIPPSLRALDQRCRQIKRNAVQPLSNLHLVALSRQMLDICSKSEVLQGLPISLIHNGVYTDTFVPQGKIESRRVLQLPINEDEGKAHTIFMACGFDLFNRNKGLTRIIEALERVDTPNKMLLCVGKLRDLMPEVKASFPIRFFGPISDAKTLSQVYSAADYFIQASYEESFGQTPLEAMSCGTPVISTPCGVAPEIIRDDNGVLCRGFDVDALAHGIQQAVDHNSRCPYSSDVIRAYILKDFSYDIIADQYLDLYNEMLLKE